MLFFKKKTPKSNGIIDKLKQFSYFKMYSNDDATLVKLAGICRDMSFSKGKVIINEGDSGDELFIVINGEIDIVKKTLQNEKYTVTTLGADKSIISVGEQALIDSDKRSASVIAKTDCECLVIKRDDFIKFGDENPKIGLDVTRAIARQLSMNLRKSNADVITLFSALVEEISDR